MPISMVEIIEFKAKNLGYYCHRSRGIYVWCPWNLWMFNELQFILIRGAIVIYTWAFISARWELEISNSQCFQTNISKYRLPRDEWISFISSFFMLIQIKVQIVTLNINVRLSSQLKHTIKRSKQCRIN